MIREGRISALDRGDSFKHLVCNSQEPLLADSLAVGAQGVLKALQLLGRARSSLRASRATPILPSCVANPHKEIEMPPQLVPTQVTWPESQAGSSCPRSHAEERWQVAQSPRSTGPYPPCSGPGLGYGRQREPRPCPGSPGSLRGRGPGACSGLPWIN